MRQQVAQIFEKKAAKNGGGCGPNCDPTQLGNELLRIILEFPGGERKAVSHLARAFASLLLHTQQRLMQQEVSRADIQRDVQNRLTQVVLFLTVISNTAADNETLIV